MCVWIRWANVTMYYPYLKNNKPLYTWNKPLKFYILVSTGFDVITYRISVPDAAWQWCRATDSRLTKKKIGYLNLESDASSTSKQITLQQLIMSTLFPCLRRWDPLCVGGTSVCHSISVLTSDGELKCRWKMIFLCSARQRDECPRVSYRNYRGNSVLPWEKSS